MVELGQNLKDRTRDLQTPLDRLVGIRIGTERNCRAAISLAPELFAQQLGRIRLRKQSTLKIETRRKIDIGVRRARITIDATVFTAPVGIY